MGNEAMKERVRHDFTNHPPVSAAVGSKLDEVTRRMVDLGEWIVDNVPVGREQSLALTQLEQCSMWSKAGIARNQT